MHLLGLDLQAGGILIGALTGVAYGLLGVGLVLVYRSTRIINFAHGEIGAFCAVVLAKLVLDEGWSFPLAFLAVAALGAAVGAAWELLVVRRLFAAPRLVLLVASIGMAQVMLAGQLLLPKIEHAGRYPTPIDHTAKVFDAVLSGGHLTVIVVAPLVVAALGWFLSRTYFGVAIRASADNADAARLAAINVRRISTAAWATAGLLAAVTFVLINPVRGEIAGSPTGAALGPGLLLRALAAALVGRMVSLPQALAGGVALGAVEAVLFVNVGNPGTVDACVFVIVVILVLLRGGGVSAGESGSWSLTPRVRAIPARLQKLTWVRRLPLGAAALAVALGVAAPLVLSRPSQQFTLSRVVIFALAGLSVVVITGWAGQLSLAQFALVGVGAVTTVGLSAHGVPFGFAAFYATVAGAIAATAVGGPALRIRGLLLAVTTVAFAVAARGWLLPHSLFFGDSTSAFVPRGRWWFLDLTSQRTYYYLCLTVLVTVGLGLSHLRRTGVGRRTLAVRENESAAAAVTVAPSSVKLAAFALSGAIAALAGSLLAGLYVQFGPATFSPDASLQLVSMVIIGGVGSVAGPILGAVYLIGVPAFTASWVRGLLGDSDAFVLLLGGVGLLVLLIQNPGGIVQGFYSLRDALLRRAERRLAVPTITTEAADRPAAPSLLALTRQREPDGIGAGPVLRTNNVSITFGGIVANRAISIDVASGEIVGLIGTNGAGKSTLMNAVSGFVPVGAGRIEVFGQDVTTWPAHERAALGVGRVFQEARLFPELTVRETISVALEARRASEFVPSLLALPPARRAERQTRSDCNEIVSFLGLGRYANSPNAELSTGTRRFVELGCLLAVQARLILLDEPTAGVAQRETEAFAPLIKSIQQALGAAIVIIEHDMPLVMSLSDRIYCLSAGEVIAEGPPETIRRDPQVVASYLGTDERAIQRSDTAGPSTSGGAPAPNGAGKPAGNRR